MSSRITYCKDIYYFQVFLLVPAKGLWKYVHLYNIIVFNFLFHGVRSFVHVLRDIAHVHSIVYV